MSLVLAEIQCFLSISLRSRKGNTSISEFLITRLYQPSRKKSSRLATLGVTETEVIGTTGVRHGRWGWSTLCLGTRLEVAVLITAIRSLIPPLAILSELCRRGKNPRNLARLTYGRYLSSFTIRTCVTFCFFCSKIHNAMQRRRLCRMHNGKIRNRPASWPIEFRAF